MLGSMNTLPDPTPGRLWAVILPRRASEILLELVARLACVEGAARLPAAAAVRVLDGGNCFNAYTVARLLRSRASLVEPFLAKIQVARAFTCYQMLALLADTPAGASPVVALDLPATFWDENVPPAERRSLFERSIAELRRLSAQAPVVASVHLPGQPRPDPLALLETLQASADQVWRYEPWQPQPPARLFE
jgi:hypothetical protein